jgi:hypothetical protein
VLKITFDCATWRLAAIPDHCADKADIKTFLRINAAIAKGTLAATVPETVFTVEALKKSLKQRFERNHLKSHPDVTARPDGTVGMSQTTGPEPSAQPGREAHVPTDWDAARRLGFKILRCSRLAMTANPALKSEWCVGDTYNIAKRFGACTREIAAMGRGFGPWEALEAEYSGIGQPWDGIAGSIAVAEANAIAKAAVEWSDADTVAAHYAYGNDYICVRDLAAGDGVDALFSAASRASLASKFDVVFVSARQLAGIID